MNTNTSVARDLKSSSARIYNEWLRDCSINHNQDLALGESAILEAALVTGIPTVFYPGGIKTRAPEIVAGLERIAAAHGFDAREDRRGKSHAVTTDRRRGYAVIICLSSLLLMRQPAFGADGHQTQLASISSELIVDESDGQIRLMPRKLSTKQMIHTFHQLNICDPAISRVNHTCIALRPEVAKKIIRMLMKHLQPDSRKPPVVANLRIVANYYSQFPFILDFLTRVDDFPYTLQAAARQWQTMGTLKNNRLLSATVLFDLNAAAQMHFYINCQGQPLCTAMPADALLHELLHVYLMFTKPQEFVDSARDDGYPHAQESEVIALERDLYTRMTQIDHLPRPNRQRHLAQIVSVNCPVCWSSDLR